MLLKIRVPFVDVNTLSYAMRHCLQRLRDVRQAVQGRRALATMDARMLADIGLSHAEAEAEINRKPWDIGPR